MMVEIVVQAYDRPFGIPRYSQSLIRGLSEQGIEHMLVVTAAPKILVRTRPLLATFHIDLSTAVRTYPFSLGLHRDSIKHLTNHTLATSLLLRRLENTVVTVHDLDPDWLTFKAARQGLRYYAYWLLHNLSVNGLRRADRLVTDTVYIREQLARKLNFPKDRISVIPLGVDHGLFQSTGESADHLIGWGLDRDSRYFLHVGTDAPRKNLPNLIRAIVKVREESPEIYLVKVGKPSWNTEANYIKRLIQKHDLQDHVLFFDAVSDQDLALLYSCAVALVYPSFHEGFGLPVLEAMACGTPVVTSNTSSLPEVAGDAALLVDPTDVDAIADAMRRILEDPDLAADLRARGLERASQFTWERTARETVKVYEKVLGQKLLD